MKNKADAPASDSTDLPLSGLEGTMLMALDRHSAEVKLRLTIDGVELRLSHVGPNELVAREPCEPIGSRNAKLVMSVDG